MHKYLHSRWDIFSPACCSMCTTGFAARPADVRATVPFSLDSQAAQHLGDVYRLLKLDVEALHELHYQMITLGKVCRTLLKCCLSS